MKSVTFFIAAGLGAGMISVHAQAAAPCALVCFPPTVLDARKCSCVAQSPSKSEPCALVCLGPNETLDSKQCLCVKAGSKLKK